MDYHNIHTTSTIPFHPATNSCSHHWLLQLKFTSVSVKLWNNGLIKPLFLNPLTNMSPTISANCRRQCADHFNYADIFIWIRNLVWYFNFSEQNECRFLHPTSSLFQRHDQFGILREEHLPDKGFVCRLILRSQPYRLRNPLPAQSEPPSGPSPHFSMMYSLIFRMMVETRAQKK
jgi:hypothetical protein